MSNIFVTPWTVAHQTPLSKVLQARILELVVISFSSGLFLIQGLHLYLLRWQVDSLPLSHQEAHVYTLLKITCYTLIKATCENRLDK